MPTLFSFSPNTKAESSKVNSNFSDINNVLRPTFLFAIDSTLFTGTNLTPIIIVPQAMTIVKAYASIKTAPTGADLIIDLNKDGTTIWSTQANRLTISDGATTATQTSFNTTSLAEGSEITVDLDQVGSTVSGADLTIALKCSL